MSARPIYLDHHATTPVDPRVLEKMRPFLEDEFGNASSRTHTFGWRADEAVDVARRQVAALLGCRGKEVVFTSSATEANNLALLGYCRSHRHLGAHLVVSAVEHKAVLDAAAQLEREGFSVSFAKPNAHGVVDRDAVEAVLQDDTLLVAVMLANNEVGTVMPIAEIAQLCDARGIALFVDAVQGIGRVAFNLEGVTLASISGHKIYGPKGVGALFVRARVELTPLMFGGGQERGLRPSTLNVPGIVGLGAACELMAAEGSAEALRLGVLRDALRARLVDAGGIVNGGEPRLTHNLSVRFSDVEAEMLILAAQDEVALSSGSACTTQSLAPSHVLLAMGLSAAQAHQSIRVALGRSTTEAEIERAGDAILAAVDRVRKKG